MSVCVCLHGLSLFVSLGKSRQWDPWLQRPSCHSKSQSHLWHWAPWSYYLWALVHHLPGWERGKARECGRGKLVDRMLLSLHACRPYAHTVLCIKGRNIPHISCDPLFLSCFPCSRTKQEYCVMLWDNLLCSTELLCSPQLHTARRERSPLPDDKVR